MKQRKKNKILTLAMFALILIIIWIGLSSCGKKKAHQNLIGLITAHGIGFSSGILSSRAGNFRVNTNIN